LPKVKANNITINYDQQGTGEALILIPYLSADHACYAFQVAEYAKHFTCFSLDLRGTGESDKPAGAYSSRVSRTQRRDRRDNLRNSLRAPRALR
jgi:pimeloyl-ACP methyl ester carboxylesterase